MGWIHSLLRFKSHHNHNLCLGIGRIYVGHLVIKILKAIENGNGTVISIVIAQTAVLSEVEYIVFALGIYPADGVVSAADPAERADFFIVAAKQIADSIGVSATAASVVLSQLIVARSIEAPAVVPRSTEVIGIVAETGSDHVLKNICYGLYIFCDNVRLFADE